MKMQGFFDEHFDNAEAQADCKECGLYQNCESPQMKPTGKGKMGIMILGEAPGETEDQEGEQWVGKAGNLLQEFLSEFDINLKKDCRKHNAVCCRPMDSKGNNRTPTNSELALCRRNIVKAITEFKPKAIFLMGGSAVDSFFAFDPITNGMSISHLRGRAIPYHQYNCWVFPMFHPSYILRNGNDKKARRIFYRDLKHAVESFEKPLPDTTFIDNVKLLTQQGDIESLLRKVRDEKPAITFDYETNALSPYRENPRIRCISLQYIDKKRAYCFPYQYQNDDIPSKLITKLWGDILFDKEIAKVGQNIKFESHWGLEVIGKRTRGWIWDTMVNTHILEGPTVGGLTGINGLKEQAFLRWGIQGYDDEITPFMTKVDKTGQNSLHKAPLSMLLKYCAIDSLTTTKLYHEQEDEFDPFLTKGRKFLQDSLSALFKVEHDGLTIDEDYYEKEEKRLTKKADKLEEQLLESDEAKKFKKKYGREIKLGSSDDIRALFYKILKMKPIKFTSTTFDNEDESTRTASVDKSVMAELDSEFATRIVAWRKILKIRDTYMAQFKRYAYEGKLHPTYNVHTTRTYRSCVAKGTLIHVVRDFENHPNGVPIETVKKGDLVYCFDNDLQPAIRKVVWSGKTGHKKIIRLHYRGAKGNYGYLDVTPEHLIRLISGKYIKAKDTWKTCRSKNADKRGPRVHVLSLSRVNDLLYFTNCGEILEHRLIYEQLIGELKKEEVVHHKDENHFNHTPSNLEKKTLSEHSSYHGANISLLKRAKIRRQTIKRWANGEMTPPPKGETNPRYFHISKLALLRLLAKAKGEPTKVPIDFGTVKNRLSKYKIDFRTVALRYDKNGRYISRKRLFKLSKKGIEKVRQKLGHNYYRLKRLYEYYNIPFKRKWGNQYGEFAIGNHSILRIEHIFKAIDVYDLEVEEFNNFFANGICVHNSATNPNSQNIPKRDPVAEKSVRSGVIPSAGNFLQEVDYKTMEIRILACLTRDPVLMDYISKGKDMHLDEAVKLFGGPPETISGSMRFETKGGWSFAQVYGSYYENCAKHIWEIIDKVKDSKERTVREHIEKYLGIKTLKGYTNLLHDLEDEFWEKYRVTKRWQIESIKFYEKHLYVEMPFGFRRGGLLSRNKITNTPVQGTAFHCLLWSLTRLVKHDLKKYKSRIIGQIHDSLIMDIYPPEEKEVNAIVKRVMCNDVREANRFLTVPLDIDITKGEIDGSWYMKKGE